MWSMIGRLGRFWTLFGLALLAACSAEVGEIDFVALRRALAANERWTDELTEGLMPGAEQRKMLISAMPWSDHKANG